MDPLESKAGTVISAVSVLLVLITALVCLRFYTRRVILGQLGADDWAILVALLWTIACGGVIAGNTKNGLGRHVGTLKPKSIQDYLHSFYLSIVFYNASLTAVKVSFLLQYRRVFTTRKMRITLLVALVIIGCWCTSQLLIVIFNCQPISGFWDSSIKAKCIPNLPFWYINAAGNIATDVAIFVLPLPVIGSLKLAKAQKYVLLGIFSLGFFTCAISVIRIQFLKLTDDFTFENVEPAIWSVAELTCGVACACLPTLRPLVVKFVPALGSQSGTRAGYGRYGEASQSRTAAESKSSGGGGSWSKESLSDFEMVIEGPSSKTAPGVATKIAVAERGERELPPLPTEIRVKREVHIV